MGHSGADGFLPNEVVVHLGATLQANGSPSSSLHVFPLFLLLFFFFSVFFVFFFPAPSPLLLLFFIYCFVLFFFFPPFVFPLFSLCF